MARARTKLSSPKKKRKTILESQTKLKVRCAVSLKITVYIWLLALGSLLITSLDRVDYEI